MKTRILQSISAGMVLLLVSCVGKVGSSRRLPVIVPGYPVTLVAAKQTVLLDGQRNHGRMSDMEIECLQETLREKCERYPTNQLLFVSLYAIASMSPYCSAERMENAELRDIAQLLGTIRGAGNAAEGFCVRCGPDVSLFRASVNINWSPCWVYVLRAKGIPELTKWRLLLVVAVEH